MTFWKSIKVGLNNHSAILTWVFCHCKPKVILFGSRCQYPQLHFFLRKVLARLSALAVMKKTEMYSAETKRRDYARSGSEVCVQDQLLLTMYWQ